MRRSPGAVAARVLGVTTTHPARQNPPSDAEAEGRRRHYGEFYGVRPLPDDDRPLVLVHGNCQAEALRVLIEQAGGQWFATVRVPPVHELVADDLPHLTRLLATAGALVAQPVRDGYRDLPLGTSEVAVLLTPGAAVVRVPSIRYAGLFPHQVLVRSPGIGDPPVVPYHDLRTLAEAATGVRAARTSPAPAYRAIEEQSVQELRAREAHHGTVVVSDLLRAAGTGSSQTVNHPGNAVLRGAAERVLARLGHEVEVADPGRTLLNSVRTPLAADVLAALGLDVGAARDHWVVDGAPVEDDLVREEQLRWYAARPQLVEAGLSRHHDALALLGLV